MVRRLNDDQLSPPAVAKTASLAGAIAGAKLAVYDSGGHLLVGRRKEVRKVVDAFIAGLAAGDGAPRSASSRQGAAPVQ